MKTKISTMHLLGNLRTWNNLPQVILVVLLLCKISSPQNIPDSFFINTVAQLSSYSKDMSFVIAPSERARCNRLGISYTGINNKFFISEQLLTRIKAGADTNNATQNIIITHPAKGTTFIDFAVNGDRPSPAFIFQDSFLISRPHYFSRSMRQTESEYFSFFISDKVTLNTHEMSALDCFVEQVAQLLHFTEDELRLLKQKKICYYLCQDENEVKKLSGYSTAGIYLLSEDCIVTKQPCHFHELCHLLINYKLHGLPLFTNPFFQEGFAVALGGRAGKDAGVLCQMGKYLIVSGFQSPIPLLCAAEFRATDPSVAYPVSGVYNKYLLQTLTTQQYLNLYLKYSGASQDDGWVIVNDADLPDTSLFSSFLASNIPDQIYFSPDKDVIPLRNDMNKQGVYAYKDDAIYVHLKDTLLLYGEGRAESSVLFFHFFPSGHYAGQKFLVIADSLEISVYNLFTGNMIAKYAASFSTTGAPVPFHDGLYEFFIKKACFGEMPRIEQPIH